MVSGASGDPSGRRSGAAKRDSMKKLYVILIVMACLLSGALVGGYRWLHAGLPPISRLQRIEPSIKTLFFSAGGDTLAEFYEENRVLVPFERIPPAMIEALLAIEDRAFYDHWGINVRAILRAFVRNVEAGRVVQGGSTITQQLARELFLTKEQTYVRKALEAMVALEIEKAYTKNEILEMYLNQIYFGSRSYGIEAAAQTYFGKHTEQLGIAECALLAGLPKNPRDYSPTAHPDAALRRRGIVLQAMVETGAIRRAEADSVGRLPLLLGKAPGRADLAPYFVEYVRQILEDRFPEGQFRHKGLRVFTTLDMEAQRLAEASVEGRLREIEKKWFFGENTRKHYLALEEKPAVPDYLQGAVVVLKPGTGRILALVGGRNYTESNWNRATQATRQPGSAFKPFLFTTAIREGYRPSDTILDSPVVLPQADGSEWRPQNYHRRFHGLVSLREALARSMNLPAVKLILAVGPDKVAKTARAFGITSPIRPVPSLALGSSEVTLLELTRAYSVFRNNGILMEAEPIDRIEDRNGMILYRPDPPPEEVIPAPLCYVMTDMLESVVNSGTGVRIRSTGWKGHVAGKTGTTDDYNNAWFVGFTPDVVTGVWVGYDEPRSIGPSMSGAAAALPIWIDVSLGLTDSTNLEPFHEKPPGVTSRRICSDTGFLASPFCPDTREEIYLEATAPRTVCHLHGRTVKGKEWIEFGGG